MFDSSKRASGYLQRIINIYYEWRYEMLHSKHAS